MHNYLGMTLDYMERGKVKINMTKYISEMIKDSPIMIQENDKATTPATEQLFEESKGKCLNLKLHEGYHQTMAKGLFASKCARPDIQTMIAVLCTQVKEPNKSDLIKAHRLPEYLNTTKDNILSFSTKNLNIKERHVDMTGQNEMWLFLNTG